MGDPVAFITAFDEHTSEEKSKTAKEHKDTVVALKAARNEVEQSCSALKSAAAQGPLFNPPHLPNTPILFNYAGPPSSRITKSIAL